MRQTIGCWLAVGMMAALTGCEWEGSGDSGTWNDRWNWVNFSGVYRGTTANDGMLVSDYTAQVVTDTGGTSGTDGYTETVTNIVSGESQGEAAPNQTIISGQLAMRPNIAKGSVTLTFSAGSSAGSFKDNGDGTLSGNYNLLGIDTPIAGSGTINYETGAWTITLGAPGFLAPATITASYIYYTYVNHEGTPGSDPEGPTGPQPGSSGVTIYAFTVHQEGQTLTITDNNGATYRGTIGSIRAAGGGDSAATIADQDTIIAQYQVEGTSASGLHVKMVGTFQSTADVTTSQNTGGTSSSSQTLQISMPDRTMTGTWIESGGRTGDINGQTTPTTVTTTTDTTTV